MFQLSPDILVIDNFYDDPYSIRDFALNCEYYQVGFSNGFKDGNGPFSGRMSKEPFIPKNLDQQLSKMFNKHLYPRQQSDHGYFRITHKTDKFHNVVHADSTKANIPNNSYVGIVYLSLDKDSLEIPATIFYKHKDSNCDYLIDYNMETRFNATKEFENLDNWEETFSVRFKFNRLVIYPPYCFHKVGESFGDSDENARLIQLFSWGEIY